MVEETETGEPKISKRKLKKQNRLSVAELKQLVARPDVVEMHDVTARDPRYVVLTVLIDTDGGFVDFWFI